MKLALPAALLLWGAAASAQETGTAPKSNDSDRKVISAFEGAWQKAAEKAAASVVAIRVDREESRVVKGGAKNPLGNNPMTTGGVFSTPPEKSMYLCPDCGIDSTSPGACSKCEKEMKKVFRSLCSGTVIDANGVIATTNFNVTGKLTRIVVVLSDGKELVAKELAHNKGADLALLQVEAKGLPVLKAADVARTMKVGEPVVLLGRGPDGRGLTLNPGIISAPARHAGAMCCQTDAHTNFGNVGGPLIDMEGRLIGITCKVDAKADIAGTFGQNSGVSFALTVDKLEKLTPDLKLGRSTEKTGQPFMGIAADQTATDIEGVKLGQVIPGGGAEKAGVKAGDIILEFDGITVKNFDELRELITKKAVNDPFRIKVRRGEEELEIAGTIGERPSD